MDGFHLANVELARLGLAHRKGAVETFDGWGYLALVQRLRRGDEPVVYAPTYDRSVEESVAGAIAVRQDVDVVVTEGNYLLLDDAPWVGLRALLDLVVYLDVDDAARRQRLMARHVAFGKSPAAASAWVATVDERNAVAIAATRRRADIALRWS
jgi:pantothenate kinase